MASTALEPSRPTTMTLPVEAYDESVAPQRLAPLRPLPVPVRIAPTTRTATQRSRAVTALKRIEFVRVRGGARQRYRLELFYVDDTVDTRTPVRVSHRQRNHAQLQCVRRRLRPSSGAQVSATISVEHTFADFLELRARLFGTARFGDGDLQPCAFCYSVVHANAFGAATPRWNSTWFRGPASMCLLLTAYMNRLLRLAVAAPERGGAHCAAKHAVPAQLLQFLTQPATDLSVDMASD